MEDFEKKVDEIVTQYENGEISRAGLIHYIDEAHKETSKP